MASHSNPGAGAKFHRVMSEFHNRTLKSGGSGKKVTSPKQAVAIAFSEQRRANARKAAKSRKRKRRS